MRRFYNLPHWLILMAVAVPLRLVGLGSESLWFDESFTWLVAKQDANFWKAVLGDDHPPLWSMLQWLNMRLLGGSEFAFRLPALICSVVCVLLIWRIALALRLDRATALLAGLIAAVLPASIYFGQDGRMYAALAMFILLALWAALKEHWIIFALGCIGAVYTQNAGLFYVAALGSVVLVCRARNWRELVKPVLALIAVVLAWSPWLGEVLIQASRVKESFWMPPMSPVSTLWPLLLDTMFSRTPDLLQIPIYSAALGMMVLGLIVAYRWAKNREGVTLLATIAGGPILLAVFSSLWQRNIYVYRPLLVTGLLLSILWAYPLIHLSKTNKRATRLIFGATLAVAILCQYTNNLRENIPAWLSPVTSAWQPGDVLYYTDSTYAILFGHYLDGKPAAIRPYHGSIMTITDEDRSAFGLDSEQFDHLTSMGYRRVWLIVIHNPFTTPEENTYLDNIFHWYNAITIVNEPHQKISVDQIFLIDLQHKKVEVEAEKPATVAGFTRLFGKGRPWN